MKKGLLMLLFFPIMSGYAQSWEKKYDYVDNCVCGLSKVKKDGKVGYVNNAGVEVVKLQYDEGLTYNEGYTAVKKESKWLYLDSTGKAITAAVYDDASSFNNGLAAVSKDNLYGFIDSSGALVILCKFNNARSFTEGLAPASNAKGYWGYIDVKGEWALKPIYDFAYNFENGEAKVMKGQKEMYIDKTGKVVRE
jgi:WG containing repeat